MTSLAISFDDVLAAQSRVQGVVHKTPVMRSRLADKLAGAEIFFKCENFQRAGAFKIRGAYNALSQFSSEQRKRGVVTFSSGNHAQGIALSAQLLGIRAVIVMPQDAPVIKINATRGYGAEVVLYDRYQEDRDAIGRRLAEEQGLTLIPPYDHPHVMAGQGTAAKELFDDVGALDALFIPLGGGGLLSGCATTAKALYPDCRVIGVEPEAGNDGQQSLAAGKIIHIATPKTIADGAQTLFLGQFTFPVIQQKVEQILTATDAQLILAMKFFAERMKMLVEPTACLGAAAVLAGRPELKGKRVGVILTGGNIDLLRFSELIQTAA